MKKNHLIMMQAIITYMGFHIELSELYFFKHYNITLIFFLPMIYAFYKYVSNLTLHDEQKMIRLPAFLFSCFTLFGYSFNRDNSWRLVFSVANGQFLKAILAISGLFFLFYYIVSLIFHAFDCFKKSDFISECLLRYKPVGWYIAKLQRYPFRVTFITLLICYIPYMILSYPTVIAGDAKYQIYQMHPEFGELQQDYMRDRLLSEDVFLNTHHPVIHTLLINLCLNIGIKLFHSGNKGLFIWSFAQMLCMFSAISYAVKCFVSDLKVPIWYEVLLIGYFIFSPRVQSYMFVDTKDVPYSISLLFFCLFLWKYLKREEYNKIHIYVGLVLSGLGIFFFRNEGRYVLLFMFVLLAMFYKKHRKEAIGAVVAVVVLIVIFGKVLTLCNVTSGSKREMLSVPFQQTARYIREHGAEVTDEEKTVIDKVLDYNVLAENYSPTFADPVKDTYREEATIQDLLDYFKVWFSMLFKHPGCYIQATFNNYYSYFYPGGGSFDNYSYERTAHHMNGLSKRFAQYGIDFSYPSTLDSARNRYEQFRESLAYAPIISVLMIPAVYIWFLLLMICNAIRKRSKDAIIILMLPLCILGICLLAPCDAYHCRYVYPLLICLPVIYPITAHLKQ